MHLHSADLNAEEEWQKLLDLNWIMLSLCPHPKKNPIHGSPTWPRTFCRVHGDSVWVVHDYSNHSIPNPRPWVLCSLLYAPFSRSGILLRSASCIVHADSSSIHALEFADGHAGLKSLHSLKGIFLGSAAYEGSFRLLYSLQDQWSPWEILVSAGDGNVDGGIRYDCKHLDVHYIPAFKSSRQTGKQVTRKVTRL